MPPTDTNPKTSVEQVQSTPQMKNASSTKHQWGGKHTMMILSRYTREVYKDIPPTYKVKKL